jgi:ADP-heptose:LPS heptosyltransferase
VQKNILVFTNGEKIGDGIIKLPLLNEIKRRLPDRQLIWMTNKGSTVYNNQLKNIAGQYIDKIIEKADLKPFFWQRISNKYDFSNRKFEYIFDTQKAVLRTIALKRIKSSHFISSAASGYFSTNKIKKKYTHNSRQYYLEDLFDLLDILKEDKVDRNFKITLPPELIYQLGKIFDQNNLYIGFAPGAGEKKRIWPIDNFIKVGKYFENKSYKIVFFLGPEEKFIKDKLKTVFPNALLPEEQIQDFSGYEVVIGSTNFLTCALANDSGAGHMLSTNYCPLIKLFAYHDISKFTPDSNKIKAVSAKEFGSTNMSAISTDYVIKKIEDVINTSTK